MTTQEDLDTDPHADVGKEVDADAHQPGRQACKHTETLTCPQTHRGSQGHTHTWVHTPPHTRRHPEGVRGTLERQAEGPDLMNRQTPENLCLRLALGGS